MQPLLLLLCVSSAARRSRPPARGGSGKSHLGDVLFLLLFCSPSFLPLSGGPYCHFALGESEEEETAEELGGAIPPSHCWQKN